MSKKNSILVFGESFSINLDKSICLNHNINRLELGKQKQLHSFDDHLIRCKSSFIFLEFPFNFISCTRAIAFFFLFESRGSLEWASIVGSTFKFIPQSRLISARTGSNHKR